MTQALPRLQNSTTVRSNDGVAVPFALRWARSQIALRSTIAPALGERYALKLFTTPRRFPFSDAEFELLATARPFRVKRLAAWQWGTGPVVLLMHGWEGRGAQLGALVEPLVARGFSVVTFDAPAHGVSPGTTATIPDFARAAQAVARRVGPIHAVVAHSLGALGALHALGTGLSARAVVLMGAPSPGAHFQSFRRHLEIPESVVRGLRARIESTVGISFTDVEGPALARHVNVPALVVHDRTDKEAAFESGRAIAAALPDASFVLTEGLGHRRILGDPGVVAATVEFITSRTA